MNEIKELALVKYLCGLFEGCKEKLCATFSQITAKNEGGATYENAIDTFKAALVNPLKKEEKIATKSVEETPAD